jgi:RNA ligase-like protein
MEFEAFPKLPRLNRGMVISEKIDGTNACVSIGEYDAPEQMPEWRPIHTWTAQEGATWGIWAQSRKRMVQPGKQDNAGFAGWVKDHAEELAMLGPGRHFGEWWGLGIQRGYEQDRKRFSLFNSSRWLDDDSGRPTCCDVVPVLAAVNFSQAVIDATLEGLREEGSQAAPGFMNPEGVVVYLSAARSMFKVTLKDDELPKSVSERLAA